MEVFPPISNASGVRCTTYQELLDLSKSKAGYVVTKSITLKPRKGNPEPRLKESLDMHPKSSINSMGLPNPGYEYYLKIIPKISKLKPVVVSIAAIENLEEYYIIAKEFEKLDIYAIEYNISCPNVEGSIGYNLDLLEEALKIFDEIKKPYYIKVPPYNFDLKFFGKVADLISDSKAKGIVAINSVQNAMDIDLNTLKKVIKPRRGYGGLGGDVILYIAIAEVNRWYSFFKEHGVKKEVVGVGGIFCPEAAIKHFLAGASKIQIGTLFLQKGVKVFEDIWKGVEEWLRERGFKNYKEIIGIVEEL